MASKLVLSTIDWNLCIVKGGLSLFCAGASFTWTAPLLTDLQSPSSEVPLTSDQSSWVVAFIELGNLVTPIPAGFLVDRWGRKPCLLLAAPLYVLTWLLVLFVKTVTALYVMRIAQGMAMSVQLTILPMYLAEIAGPTRRGALSSFYQGMWYAGVLYQYVVGAFFGYNGLTCFSMGPPLVFMSLFAWCPESPYFLLMRGRRKEAGAVLAWLRGLSLEDVEPELQAIGDSIAEERKEQGSWRDIVQTKAGRKAMCIVLVLCTTEIMSGMTSVISYVSDTFATTSGNQGEANTVSILLGCSLVLVTIVSACLSDRLGRRPLLLVSSCTATVCLAATTLFFFFKERNPECVAGLWWFPYLGIILFTNFMSFGVGALIPTLQSELFPNSTRGIACGMSTLHNTVLSFLCLKMYQVIGDSVGLYVNYAVFTLFSALGTVFIYAILPETKGKTFPEIQKMLQMD